LKPKEVAQLQKQGQVALVDTRAPEVFRRSHIAGAINVPLEEVSTRIDELSSLRAAPVLYCRTGNDTKALAATLASQGTPVAYLDGGVLGWEADGFTLQRPD
jgi:thioredoxin 1/putative thioredoxin